MNTRPIAKLEFLLAVFLLAFFASGARADTVNSDDLKKIIDQKNEEIRKLEEQADKFRSEILSKKQTGNTLKSELARIEKTIRQLQGDIVVTERRLQKTELEIQKTKLEIGEKEKSIGTLKRGLSDTMQAMFETEKETPLKALFKNNSMSDFFSQLDYSEFMQAQVLNSLDVLRGVKAELGIKKAEAEEQKGELKNLETTLAARKKITENTQKDRKNLLTMTKNQEALYQQMLKQNERRQEEILKEIESLETNLRKSVKPASLPKFVKGVLETPVEGRLSQGYGETAFAKKRDFYKFHNGIDLAAPVGTVIIAASGGEVLATGNTDNYCPGSMYGKYIVIDHQNNLATMYGHLSLISVSAGQKVKRGDIIGYVGMSGLTTGPHLHFTAYDARTVEVRRGPTGACGPLPYGGSVNPLNYLNL